MTVCPATVIVPVREAADALAATEKVTVPSPVPDPPVLIVMNGELLTAVHEHPGSAVTPTVPVPPEDGNDARLGLPTV